MAMRFRADAHATGRAQAYAPGRLVFIGYAGHGYVRLWCIERQTVVYVEETKLEVINKPRYRSPASVRQQARKAREEYDRRWEDWDADDL